MTGEGVHFEWAMILDGVVGHPYPQKSEDEARDIVEFYREHYPGRRPVVARRAVTVGPWESAGEDDR